MENSKEKSSNPETIKSALDNIKRIKNFQDLDFIRMADTSSEIAMGD
jgi:hypothetical protein